MATLAAGTAQSAGPSAELTARRAAAEDRPSSLQQCRTRGTVTYCAFPTFAPRMEQWNEVVTGVRRHVPPARAAAPFTVRQRAATLRSVSTSWSSASWGTASLPSWQADDRQAGTPDPISVGTQWGPDSGAFPVEFPFAVHVAYRFVTGSSPREETNLICGAAGAVLVWLAGQATPQTREEAREHAAYTVNRTESFRSATLGPSVDVGRREADLAYALLQQPTEQVAAALTGSWADLTARATTVEQAAKIFGVNAAAPLAEVPAGEESTIGDCG
jgi:hypothetical protein